MARRSGHGNQAFARAFWYLFLDPHHLVLLSHASWSSARMYRPGFLWKRICSWHTESIGGFVSRCGVEQSSESPTQNNFVLGSPERQTQPNIAPSESVCNLRPPGFRTDQRIWAIVATATQKLAILIILRFYIAPIEKLWQVLSESLLCII